MLSRCYPLQPFIAAMRRLLTVCLLALLASACGEPAHFNATDITGADFGRDFVLNDPQGRPRRLADFRGQVVVVFFGYTQCPDVCPTTLSTMARVMGQLGADAGRVQVVFVTVDPERDTPALLATYTPAFHPSFIGLSGDAQATQVAMREFRVYAEKNPGGAPGQYTVDHTAQSYVFDPKGKLRLIIRHGAAVEAIVADLHQLLNGA